MNKPTSIKICEGFLRRQEGSLFKNYKQRFFCLKSNGVLYQYASQTAKKAEQKISLYDCTLCEFEKPFFITLHFEKRKPIFFTAENEQAASNWCIAFRNAITQLSARKSKKSKKEKLVIKNDSIPKPIDPEYVIARKAQRYLNQILSSLQKEYQKITSLHENVILKF